MKKLLLLLSFLPLCIWGNEGMWLPCCLSKQTQQVMKEMGLELSSEQLYNPGGKALANAVVSFGGFCSGVVVSPDGLVFTNHHCGYDAIQQHSSVEHDYLRDGFVADSLSKELPNPDLFVSFLIRTEDVTERVLQAILIKVLHHLRLYTANIHRIIIHSLKNNQFGSCQIKKFQVIPCGCYFCFRNLIAY